MAIPNFVRRCLIRQDAEFQIVNHPRTETLEQAAASAEIPLHKLARAIFLKDEQGPMMAVVPASHVLDFEALHGLLKRPGLELAAPEDCNVDYEDCEPGSHPPLGEVLGIEMVVDQSLLALDKMYFEPGVHTALVGVRTDCVRQLFAASVTGAIAQPMDLLMESGSTIEHTSHSDIKRRVEELYELPPMPKTTQRIMELMRGGDGSAEELAQAVELDPSLAAQVVRYARSPLFGYQGRIASVRDAIARVLGFDMVMNLAVGVSIARSLRNPVEGPLGLEEFWRHATYCAALTQSLAKAVSPVKRPQPGTMYLAGLLHNFGFLLLGHLFQPEFYLLNKLVAANPDLPVTQLEHHVLGMGQARGILEMGHAQIGAWLMQSWNLPEEIVLTLREHHNPAYNGPHANYVQLLVVANHLLKRYGIGDAPDEVIPPAVLTGLGLAEHRAVQITEQLLEGCDELNAIAKQMAA